MDGGAQQRMREPDRVVVPHTQAQITKVPGWNVTLAVVSREVGGCPALSSARDRAIEKQLECAAAMSSSGLVLPFASSARDAHETS